MQPNQKLKTISILTCRFEVKDVSKIKGIQEEFRRLSVDHKKRLKLIDKINYYPHVFRDKEIMYVNEKDLYEINKDSIFCPKNQEDKNLSKSNLKSYIDDKQKLEIKDLKFIFFYEAKLNFGLLFFYLEIEFSDEHIDDFSSSKFFRYIKKPNEDERRHDVVNKLKILDDNNSVDNARLIDLFVLQSDLFTGEINFLDTKPIQIHFLSNPFYSALENPALYSYNILRSPSILYSEIDNEYIKLNQDHISHNSSVFSFTMAEGSVIISPKDKSLKKLFIRFFPVHFLAIINKEIITHLISMLALKVNFSEIEFTDTYLKDLKRLTCKINGYNFISVLPVSPYSEIEEIYYRLKSNLNSRSSGDSIGSTLNEITTLVQEETERLKQEREKKIGYFIGALGLTGLISYFFDYVYISNNEKLIDGIIYPLNLVPILLLFILFFVFLFIFGVIKIRTDDWFVKRR